MPYPLRTEYPALTRAQLVVIGDRYGDDPVVRRLLMEVWALRNLVRRVHQVAEAAGPSGGTTEFGIAVAALRRQLAAETWFQEELAEREAARARWAAEDVASHKERAQRRRNKW
jgi:hypothetical protein